MPCVSRCKNGKIVLTFKENPHDYALRLRASICYKVCCSTFWELTTRTNRSSSTQADSTSPTHSCGSILGAATGTDGRRFFDSDAQAIHLAKRYDTSNLWYPVTMPPAGEVQMWLFADSLTGSISARLHDLFFFDFDAEACRKRSLSSAAHTG
jgi:hypothetical protein